MKNSELSAFQLFSVTCFSMLFGMTLFPSAIGHEITTAWFFGQLITIVLVFGVLLLALKTADACPEKGFTNALGYLTGNIISKPLSALLGLYFIVQAGWLLLIESDNLMLFLFERTPMWVIILVFATAVPVVAFSGLKQAAKAAEILTPMFIFLLTVLFIMLLSRCCGEEMKTLFQPKMHEIPRQAALSMNSFTCIELSFFSAFETQKKGRKKALIIGYLVNVLLLIVAFLALTGTYTVKGGASLVLPFTELTRSIELGSADILERLDVIFISVRIIVCIVFAAIACSLSAQCFACTIGKPNVRLIIPVSALLLILMLVCYKYSALLLLMRIAYFGECAVLLFLFPCLFLLSRVKRRAKS